jgi:hypothetical protein
MYLEASLMRAGVRPGSRSTFLSGKVDKTMLALAWPPAYVGANSSGALRGSPTPAARKLTTLKQCAPVSRGRLHCSAMPQGQGRGLCFVLSTFYRSLLFFSDACWLAPGSDTPINWRALFERRELVRPPQVGVRPM